LRAWIGSWIAISKALLAAIKSEKEVSLKTYRVIRYGMGRNSTLGFFTRVENGDKETRLGFTIEDERRHTKVPGETCIPTGTYDLRLNTDHMDDEGWMNCDYRKKWGDRHKGMIEITKVPDFTNVYIHILNYESETRGCIGPGETPGIHADGEFYVGRSTPVYWAIYEEIVPALIAGERVVLHVTEIQPWA
jgi:hypothetical protein